MFPWPPKLFLGKLEISSWKTNFCLEIFTKRYLTLNLNTKPMIQSFLTFLTQYAKKILSSSNILRHISGALLNGSSNLCYSGCPTLTRNATTLTIIQGYFRHCHQFSEHYFKSEVLFYRSCYDLQHDKMSGSNV